MNNTAFALWFKTECNPFCVLIGPSEWFMVNSCYGTNRRPADDVMISVLDPLASIYEVICDFLVTHDEILLLFFSTTDKPCHRGTEKGNQQMIRIRCGLLVTHFQKCIASRQRNDVQRSRSECCSSYSYLHKGFI